ncbi:MAG: MBL fold metallo-hydrolase [Actinobacteria bacterium]|nr:MBL fold metallo-hydrolase [Actinomycetota bacterium]
MGDTDRLYFRQLLSGRDFAQSDPVARQMVNFVYLIGDREKGEALAVDPAYGAGELIDLLAADGLRLTGVLATHWHADHVGGDLMGYPIEGITDIIGRDDVSAPVHIQAPEAEWLKKFTGVSDSDLVLHESGDTVMAGDIEVTLMHTPGHTSGSQCFVVDGKLIAGDTLFLDGCGRTDLPTADPDEMYFSLTQRLAVVPDDTVLYPGHLYSPEASATMGETRQRNYVFRLPTLEQWRMMFG